MICNDFLEFVLESTLFRLSFLEEDKLNLENRAAAAQFDVKQLRLRVNDMSDKKQNKLNLRK